MIACRGKNGWFDLKTASAYPLAGEFAVSIGSKKPWHDVSPIYLQGPKEEIVNLLGSLKAQVEGSPCGMFELVCAECSTAHKCSGGTNPGLCAYCCHKMDKEHASIGSLEPSIEECAEIARQALLAIQFSMDGENLESSISDLVADLLHLARLNDIDPEDIIETAQMHFDAEVEERGTQHEQCQG